eukprot:3596626-Ditylum_brightwellii.AAC.1
MGGSIERLKTSYSLIIRKFSLQGQPIVTEEEELPSNAVVIHRDEYDTTIHRSPPSKSNKMIRVNQALTMQESTELQYLTSKINRFIKVLKACPTNHRKV